MARHHFPCASELQQGEGYQGGDGENKIESDFLEMDALVLTEVLVSQPQVCFSDLQTCSSLTDVFLVSIFLLTTWHPSTSALAKNQLLRSLALTVILL